jgi:RNA polymerase sigma-70 factor (ECF subfamily)
MKVDSKSMEAGLEKYRNYLCMLARQQLNPRLRGKLDASDIVQDVLLQAYLSRSQYRGASEPERIGWLQRILTNKLTDVFRQFARERRDVDLEVSLEKQLGQSSAILAGWLASDMSSPSVKAGRNEQILRLASTLADLPDDQRDAIEMHHLQGLPLVRIAELMERSKHSVAGLIFRGVMTIRKRLGATGGVDHV